MEQPEFIATFAKDGKETQKEVIMRFQLLFTNIINWINTSEDKMRSIPILLILIFNTLATSTHAQELSKQKIDFSGVDAFWMVAENIANETVTETDWEYLFSTGYYKFYENWGQRNQIKKTLVTALSPNMQSARDSLMNIPDFYAFILKQVVSTYADRIELKKFQENLATSDIQKKIVARAKEFLPGDLDSKAYEPFIYFGVFQPDANASETSLAIDLKLYFELADPIGLIAHEYHHFVTMNYRKKFKEIKNDSTSSLMKSISQLQLEGIADMIDKEKFLNSDGRGFPAVIGRNFKKVYTDPLPALKKMDSLLVAISKEPLSAKRNSEAILNALPLSGHPHGFYMAQTIQTVYGNKTLLTTVRNPFDFIRVYNKAYRKQNGTAIFSAEAMKFLSRVESTHSL